MSGHGRKGEKGEDGAGAGGVRGSGTVGVDRWDDRPEDREARYRALVDATARMVWTTDPDGLVEDMPFWRELTGQSLEEVRGNGWANAIHPDDRQRVFDAWMEAGRTRLPYSAEYRLRLSSGAYRRYRARGVPVLDENGRVREWIGAFEELDPSARRERVLLSIARSLGDALTPTEIAARMLGPSLTGTDADAGSLVLAHYAENGALDAFDVLAVTGYGASAPPVGTRLPLEAGRPVSEALRTGEPVFAGSLREMEEHFPGMPRLLPEQYESCAAIPVVREGRSVAGLFFTYRDPQEFDERTRTFFASLAELCAQALARAELLASERAAREQSELILSSIRDGFVMLDRDLRFRFVNRAAEVLMQRPAAEVIGKTPWEALPVTPDSSIPPAIRGAMADQQPRTIEAYSSGLGCWVEMHIYPTPTAISVLFQDVSERRRHRASSEFLSEASRILSSSLDYEATIAAVVRAAVPGLGDWCAVDLLAEPGVDEWPPRIERIAIHHQDPDRLKLGLELERRFPTDWSSEAGLAAVIRDGTPVFVPVITDEMIAVGTPEPDKLDLLRRLQFSSVIIVPLEARGVRLGALTLCMTESGRHYDERDFDLAQELARRAALAVDNARLYRDAERLYTAEREARAEADRANAAKTMFLRTMSHELRTPLGVISGILDLWELGTRGPVSPQQQEDIARMRRNQRYLLGLITDILDLARIEAGRVDLDLREVRVRDVLDDVAALTGSQADQQKIRLVVDAPDDSLVMRVDRPRMVQVIVNLVSNALKATPAEGRITLSARAAEGGMVEVAVADTGVGIPRDKLEVIFDPFVQLGRSLSSGHEGTGLGLSISRELARAMGGEIAAESTPGDGAVFRVTVPSGQVSG